MKNSACVFCHTDNADGTFGGVIPFDMAQLGYPSRGKFKADSVMDLAEYLAAIMPIGDSNSCVDKCAIDIAAYLWTYVQDKQTPVTTPTPQATPSPPEPTLIPTPSPQFTPGPAPTPAPFGDAVNGQRLMQSALCAACHQDNADGIFAGFAFDMAQLQYPARSRFKANTVMDLAEYLAAIMPIGDSNSCVDKCANDIAAYLWTYVRPKKPTTNDIGLLQGFPFEQNPQIGEKSVVWIRTEFNGAKLPADTEDKAQGVFNSFNRYIRRVSRDRFQLSNFRISPLLEANLNDTGKKGLRDLREMIKLSQDAADHVGFDIDQPYQAYIFNAPGLKLNNKWTASSMAMGPDMSVDGAIREMLPMFGLGRAEAIDGGDIIFPGKVVGALDPFFFMGAAQDHAGCNADSIECEIHAPLSIPHRARAGWLDDNEIALSAHDGQAHSFTLFNQDALDRTEAKLLAVYLTGYEKHGAFVVSYIKNTNSRFVKNPGVMVHYVPYLMPAVSRLLDLRPNSRKGRATRPGNEIYNHLYDFGDAAIQQGDAVDVSNLFNIHVLSEGVDGEGDHWAEIKIVPLGESLVNK